MRLTRKLAFGLALPLLAMAACSAGGSQAEAGAAASAAPAVHPVSGLPVIPLTVHRAGKKLAFRVEVARTGAEQAQGLMFRTTLGPDEGMIFPMHPPRQASFWMRNTVIPLDIIHIGVDGRISNIHANTVPYSESPLPSEGLVKGVLELNGGRAAELGIVPGDKVEW